MPNYVAGSGFHSAKLMIIGEAPGKQEDEQGKPFVGPSGQLIWELAEQIGFTREEVWTTNVYKYRPPFNQIKRIKEVCNPEEEVRNLWEEIRDINPSCILALGDTAFRALRGHPGITKWRGSIIKTKDGARKMVGSIHPANIVRASFEEQGKQSRWPPIWRYILKLDMERAWREAHVTDELPRRIINIALDSSYAYRLLSRFQPGSKVAVDIESHNCIPASVAVAFDRYEATVFPLWNTLDGIKFSDITPNEQIAIFHYLQQIFLTMKIVGQNFKYDQDKLEMIGFEFLRGRPIWSDTLIKAHTLIPELPSKKMEMLQSLWTKLPYHKDEGKQFNPKRDLLSRWYNYNGLDSLSTFETDEEMESDLIELGQNTGTDQIDYYYNYRMLMHEIYLDMESIGFRIDKDVRTYLKNKYQAQHDLIQARIQMAAPNYKYSPGLDKKGKKEKKFKKCHDHHVVNVAAHEQVKDFIYNYLECPKRYTRDKKTGEMVLKADEDTIVKIINNGVKDARRRNVLSDIVEDRRTRKTLGTYVLSKADYDGRIRGTYRIFGPETSRSSTQILKPPIRTFKSGHAFQTLTKHGTVGADIRALYIPDNGFVFVQVDLSQAEPRIVAVLSRDEALLRAFESGKVDIHRRTAAMGLGFTKELILDEVFVEAADTLDKDSPERFMGKKLRNGGNYNMQGGELATNINSDAKRFGINLVVSEWAASRMVEAFHAASPQIKSVFHQDVQDAINSTRIIVTPYGGARQFFGPLDNQTYKEGYAHIPQKTVAEHVKNAMIRMKREMRDFPKMLVGEAHDALLFRFPINEVVDRCAVVRKEMEKEIDFDVCTLKRGKLKIPADFEVGEKNYKEMVKLEKWLEKRAA